MRLVHSILVRAFITLVVAGCFGGTGSGLMGISNDSTAIAAATTVRNLTFFSQPSTTNVGQTITPAVQVVATDSTGASDSTFAGVITVSLSTNSTAAVLGGTKQVRAVRGFASFSTLTVDRVGSYVLRATAAGATSVTSQTFTVTTPTAR